VAERAREPDFPLGDAPLDEVEQAVQRALATGDDDALTVLGYGEISLVVGWPTGAPRWACKRLPRFASAAAAARYTSHLEGYLETLRARGVEPAPTAFATVATDDGGCVGYVVQPVLAPDALVPAVLRAAEPDADHPVLRGICDAVPAVVDDRTGLDAQVSNWAVADDGVALRYLDVSTPMVFGDDGRLVLDLGLFLAAYPWLLRAPIGRFLAPGVIGAYRDSRHVLVDLAANLIKERLTGWLPVAVVAASRVVAPAITADEVRAYYRSDARLWEVMWRLRRADRWWQRRVRRRTYPFLLPGPIVR
jgi:hypothetical protein